MKTRRNLTTQKANKEADQVFDESPHQTIPSITVLPNHIFIDILLRLRVKRIIICKSVCKTWYSLIAGPEFAMLHFAQAEVCPLVRSLDPVRISRMLFLIEPGSCNDFDVGHCMCDSLGVECDRHFSVKLDTRLKIPLRNPEMVLNNGGAVKRTRLVQWKPKVQLTPKEQKFKIVNSCNGFLCLSELQLNDPLVVCNPITGEYINLPVPKRANERGGSYINCGFGFDPKTKHYKVIRMFDIIQEYDNRKGTEIHTLGTGLWKTIDKAPYQAKQKNMAPSSRYKLAFSTYLNGCLYWFCIEFVSSNFILSFDFDTEQFQSVPPPPFKHRGIITWGNIRNLSMGLLRGCLCILDASGSDSIDIWVMKQSGDQQSWTKEFSIDTTSKSMPYELFQPISYLKNGALLMFHYPNSALICYDPEKQEVKYLKICGVKSKFEAFSYIPSFISLKDAVVGDNVVVLNFFKARSGEFKLQGETQAVFLEEEGREIASDLNFSGIEDFKWKKHWWWT